MRSVLVGIFALRIEHLVEKHVLTYLIIMLLNENVIHRKDNKTIKTLFFAIYYIFYFPMEDIRKDKSAIWKHRTTRLTGFNLNTTSGIIESENCTHSEGERSLSGTIKIATRSSTR